MENRTKKSFTLSPESVAFLNTVRERRKAASISAVLDEILQAVRRGYERAELEKAVANYYGSLSDEDVAEETRWGDFAALEFSAEERT